MVLCSPLVIIWDSSYESLAEDNYFIITFDSFLTVYRIYVENTV